jgi:tetratricopeptide (TPR) repeat protein
MPSAFNRKATSLILVIAFVLLGTGQKVRAWNVSHDLVIHLPKTACAAPRDHKIGMLIQKEHFLEEKGDYYGALQIAERLMQLTESECASNTIAGLYGVLGRFDLEILWAKRSIKINPKYVNGYINLGNAEAGLGNMPEARTAYMKAMDLAPKNPLPLYSLGVLLEKEHKTDEAAKMYQTAIELDSQFEDGYFNLAAIKANMRKFDEARILLQHLLKINPDDRDAKAMLDRVPK